MENSAINYFKIESFKSKSSALFNTGLRLNAEFYFHNNHFKLQNNIKTIKLSEIADVFGIGQFKRYYIESREHGIPLISSSEMMELNPNYEGLISKVLVKDYLKYIVSKNTILVSCSGTIGNITIVDSRLEGMAISQHALRVIPKNKSNLGLIYTFFASEFGKSLISGKKSGAVIDEIYENDLNVIDVPIIQFSIIETINELIVSAFQKRDQANTLLEKANQLVLQFNNLPSLNESNNETLDTNNKIEIREVNIKEFTSDYRLDAHFYNPIAKKAEENIKKFSKEFFTLDKLADCSYRGSRSSRNYVKEEYGIPFLSGKNVIQIRPDCKHISKTETGNIEDMLVKKGWTLITRSGTLGRTVFIWENYENYAASEHLIRIVPIEEEIDQGYLYSFLSSEYGYHQLLRFKHGAVIDEITEDQIGKTVIPKPDKIQQNQIGDLVRKAYDLRAEAIKLEDEAQELLQKELSSIEEN